MDFFACFSNVYDHYRRLKKRPRSLSDVYMLFICIYEMYMLQFSVNFPFYFGEGAINIVIS